MKVLYIAKFDLPDYQSDMIFHGLRSLLGEDCVDSNEAWYMYDDMRKWWADRVPDKGMSYGRGFTMCGKLPKLNIDRTDLESKVKNHYFDKIVFGSITRCSTFFSGLTHIYKKQDIILIDGEDDQIVNAALASLARYYKREMADKNINFFDIAPINFCIPKELIVKKVPVKTQDYGTIIPGDTSTYIFNDEKSYYEDYQKSYFGLTYKKGGWDCLRHYEILMNGCIPFFPNLSECPQSTMTRFPKQLVIEANSKMETDDVSSFYEEYTTKLLEWTREKLTTESVAKYIIEV